MSSFPTEEFIKENAQLIRTYPKKQRRGGPYTKKEREARREEVFRLHILYSVSASKISKLMNVSKPTVLGDIRAIYSKLYQEYPEGNYFNLLNTYQVRLEGQRSRLMLMLDREQDNDKKLSIERLLLEVDSRLFQIPNNAFVKDVDKVRYTTSELNKFLKRKGQKDRYLSVLDYHSLPKDKYDRVVKILRE